MNQVSIQWPSVMSLLLELRAHGQKLGTGTGFIVHGPKGPCLVTNYHVLSGINPIDRSILRKDGQVPDEVVICHNEKGKLGSWVCRTEPLLDSDGAELWTQHPVHGPKVDCVALLLTNLDGVELYPYELSPPGNQLLVSPAESVSVVGFPFGVTAGGFLGVWATGFLASELGVDWDGLPRFLIDCRARPGQSGSPVIAHRTGSLNTLEGGAVSANGVPITRFLGIYSGRIHPESDLGTVWKNNAIKAIVDATQRSACASQNLPPME